MMDSSFTWQRTRHAFFSVWGTLAVLAILIGIHIYFKQTGSLETALNFLPMIESFVLGALLRGAYKAWKETNKIEFTHVFGRQIQYDSYSISVPIFNLRTASDKALDAHGLFSSHERFVALGVDSQCESGDVHNIIASNDIIGATYLVNSLGRYTSQGPRFLFPKKKAEPIVATKSLICVGLQTNQHTPFFLQKISSAKQAKILAKKNLASVNWSRFKNLLNGENQIKTFKVELKQCKVEGYIAELIITLNGKVFTIDQSPDAESNLGLIVILKTKNNVRIDSRRILCGGAGAGGTTGSSYFLSQNWSEYVKDIGKYDAIVSFTETEMKSYTGNKHKTPETDSTIEILRIGLSEIT